VKRPEPARRTGSADPDRIAADTRRQLEHRLAGLAFRPPEPDFFDRIERFAATLATWGARTNLTAEPASADALAFHLLDSLMPAIFASRASALAGAFDPGRRILDVGAGAGFPGLVLAAATPASFVLAESRRKRASFLEFAAGTMGLGNASIERGRLATRARVDRFDMVMSRGVGLAGGLPDIAADALRAGGIAILFANQSQPAAAFSDAAARAFGEYFELPYALDRSGARVERVLRCWRRL
jgi:16S rRNA (guanine527-N7)-methyltransferase